MGERAPSIPITVELIEGLPIEHLSEQLDLAFRGGDVYQRMQAFYLVELDAQRSYQLLGFASAAHWARARYGIKPRTVRELLRVGRALRELERLDEAFRTGELNWSQARLLTRVCETETQQAWIEHAAKVSIRELEHDVKRAQRGELPRENRRGLPELRFDLALRVGALTWELWEKAKAKLAAELGELPSEEDVLRLLCTQLLETRADGSVPGRQTADDALYQIVVELRPEEAAIQTETGPVPLEARHFREVARQAAIAPGENAARANSAPNCAPCSARMRRQIKARDAKRCCHCGSPRDLMVHHVRWRSRGGPTEPSNLATVCTRCHALIHANLVRVEGQAPDRLRFLDRKGRELKGAAKVLGTGWTIERREPRERPASQFTDRNEIPREVDIDWWRAHQHLFEWSAGGNALRLRSGVACTQAAQRVGTRVPASAVAALV